MQETFIPKERYAKAFGNGLKVSQKAASVVCKAIKRKPLNRAKRLLVDLDAERRTLDGKYYSKAVREILNLVNSCEKNAEFAGLDAGRLFVHASAHRGASINRRRRKGAFGSGMKQTHIEVLLIERGKATTHKPKKHKEAKKEDHHKKDVEEIKHHQKETAQKHEHTKHEHEEHSHSHEEHRHDKKEESQ